MAFSRDYRNRYRSDVVGGEIRKAIEACDEAAVRRLLDEGLDPNTAWDGKVSHRNGTGCIVGYNEPAGETFGGRPLHEACLLKDPKIAELLIDYGADVNSTNSLGRTPLHQAADANSTELVAVLIRRGAKIDARCHHSDVTNHGSLKMGLATPLHRASASQNTEAARALLQGGASPNVQNQDGQTPLDVALDHNSIDMIRELLVGGTDLDKKPRTSRTILYQAILREDEDMAQAIAGASTFECRTNPSAHGLESFVDDLQPTYLSLIASLREAAQEAPEKKKMMESAEYIRKDLYRCLTEHSNCVQNGSQCVRLPTRVIDVGKEGEDPFLHESQENEKALYCALSHGWRKGSDTSVTTANNMESRKLGIPLSQLPKTFSEAIRFTRRLGIRYIWIDALCIIQDSPDDWTKEASRMAQVYSGALVTLAAVHTQDPTVGLFPEPDESHGSRSKRSVLDKRGWALQEQLFSARPIEFRYQSAYFDCIGYKPGYSDEKHLSLKSALRNRVLISPSMIYIRRPLYWKFRCWARMIKDYSGRSFTDDRDRLLALSAVCTKFQEAVGEDVIAGIWTGSHLAQSLLWTTEHFNGRRETDEMYTLQVPSWSWASVIQHPISYDDTLFEDKFSSEIEVLSVTSDTDDARSYWNATITLRAWVLQVRIGDAMEWKGSSQCRFDHPEEFADVKNDVDAEFWLVWIGKLAHGDPPDGYGLPLFPDGRPPSLLFLVCRPVQPGSNEYRRIGIAEAWNTDLFEEDSADSRFIKRIAREEICLV